MMTSLEREFGWTRAEISSGATIVAVLGVLIAPVVGMVIDRIGPRRVGIIGATLLCVAVGLLSTATANIWSWWFLWTMLGIAAGTIGNTVWTAGVSSLFNLARGLALALTLCGIGLGALFVPITTKLALDAFGWRGGYVALAGFWAIFTLPLIFLMFSSAIDQRRTGRMAADLTELDSSPSLSAREGWRSMRFIKLAIAAASNVLTLSAFLINMVPIFVFQGLSPYWAAAVAGMAGVGSIIGRLCGGILLDRINGRLVAAVSILFPIVSCILLLVMPGSVPVTFAAVLIVGLGAGAEYDAVAYLTAKYFGMRNFGALFGSIAGLLVLMNGIGPLVANYVYDVTGSYNPVLWALIVGSMLSSSMFLLLGPYPESTSPQPRTSTPFPASSAPQGKLASENQFSGYL
jgi:MFS family permease